MRKRSDIAHELKQPLTGIKGFAQAALLKLGEDTLIRRDLEKILEQVERMEMIINSMHALAKKRPPNK